MDNIIAYYLIFINILAAALSLYDKLAAIKNRSRIRERTLLLAAAAGGSLGLYLSMQVFRHKTRHAKFYLGVPAIILLQLTLIWWICRGQ